MNTFIQLMGKCFLIFFMFFALVRNLSAESIQLIKHNFYQLMMISDEITEPVVQTDVSLEQPKKIYLYNTHQSEEYIDGISVFEITEMLAEMLREEGFVVIFENADFFQELYAQNKDYSQLYSISRMYINEALVKYGGFDLIVDVHRDAAKRSVSVIEHEDEVYARLMFVVGNKSSNASSVYQLSCALTDKMNHRVSDIMRDTFIRQSVYNQDMAENMLLLEVGTDQNTSSEVLRSLRVFVKMLKEEGWS